MTVPGPAVEDVKIVDFKVIDLRFPTSLNGVGSDAMHVGTNGSQPYIQLITNHPGLIGEGIVRFVRIPFRLTFPKAPELTK
jgi:L-galactonate dehydratase